MELIFEIIYHVLLEGFVETWTNYMRKKNPNYNNSRFINVLMIITTIIFTLIIAVLFIGILFLFEYYFPNLFEIVEF